MTAKAIRELMTGLSGAAIAYGYGNQEQWLSITGVVVAITLTVWGIRDKKGNQVVASAVRKLIGAVGGALVVFGVQTPEQSEALAGALLPLVALYWSSKGVKPKGKLP